MLKSLKIENFRCFQGFELQQLGRINLLVGTNNSGKTSILEAVQLLYARGDFDPIASMMERRGEYVLDDGKKQFEIARLMHGHELKYDIKLSITGLDNNGVETKFSSSDSIITIIPDNSNDWLHKNKKELYVDNRINIELNNAMEEASETAKSKYTAIYINAFSDKKLNTGELVWGRSYFSFLWLSSQTIDSSVVLALAKDCVVDYEAFPPKENAVRYRIVTSSSLTPEETIELFDRTVLTPEEDLVYQALQTIEPKIKRIASVGSTHDKNAHRGGFFIQFSDSKQRVPIGSMGDGMWRVLGIALALVDVRGGVLLIDEIDTGLHYSVMSDLWKLIWKTAKELDIQVFATTHNSDCWQSLAEVIESEAIEDDLITIHRIEKGKNQSVTFNQRQIAIAAERGIEVR